MPRILMTRADGRRTVADDDAQAEIFEALGYTRDEEFKPARKTRGPNKPKPSTDFE